MKTDKKAIYFGSDPEDWRKVQALAVKLDRSVSWIVRDAIKQYIEKFNTEVSGHD